MGDAVEVVGLVWTAMILMYAVIAVALMIGRWALNRIKLDRCWSTKGRYRIRRSTSLNRSSGAYLSSSGLGASSDLAMRRAGFSFWAFHSVPGRCGPRKRPRRGRGPVPPFNSSFGVRKEPLSFRLARQFRGAEKRSLHRETNCGAQ